MDFKKEYIQELNSLDLFKNITEDQLHKGHDISLNVKEFDRPDEYLNKESLFNFSAYCQYLAIVNSKEELIDPYVFDEEDLIDEDE